MPLDYLANFTIACSAIVFIIIYSSIALLPAWDDGTGFLIFDSYVDFNGPSSKKREQYFREAVIPKSARLWASNLSVEILPEKTTNKFVHFLSFFLIVHYASHTLVVQL